MEQKNENKNKPEKKFRATPVTATIWANEGVSKTGESVTFNTISLERSYKDKQGNWKTTNSFRVSDLPKASLVLSRAYEYLVMKEDSSDYSEEIF